MTKFSSAFITLFSISFMTLFSIEFMTLFSIAFMTLFSSAFIVLFSIFLVIMYLSSAEKTASELLSDLSGYDDLIRRIKELCQEMDDYHSEQFDNWSREMLQRIKAQELR